MGGTVGEVESRAERPFRGLGLATVVVALIGLAVVLARFVLCDSGRSVCFDTATHLPSDLAVLGFLVLFMVGIGLMTFPSEEPIDATDGLPLPPPPPPLPPPPSLEPPPRTTVPPGARGEPLRDSVLPWEER